MRLELFRDRLVLRPGRKRKAQTTTDALQETPRLRHQNPYSMFWATGVMRYHFTQPLRSRRGGSGIHSRLILHNGISRKLLGRRGRTKNTASSR